jgi:hypothetical protein
VKNDTLRRFAPTAYLGLALAVAVAFLPSALRPPPEQTNDTAALNPDAPLDESSEVIQAIRQAKGAGAGASEDGVATTTTTRPGPPAKSRCVGNPARQVASVYSAPCAPGFAGDNGGATGHNVFPNEVRLGFWHGVGPPSPGAVPEQAPPGESAGNRTYRILAQYFNKHYQTWGRRIRFYGLNASSTPEEQQAEAVRADEEDQIFGAYYLWQGFCEEFVRQGNVIICNPLRQPVYEQHRPGLFSFMMNRDQALGFGAEYACKRLLGRPAKFAGIAVDKDKPRRISVIAENTPKGRITPDVFADQLKTECGATIRPEDQFELTTDSDAVSAAAAITRMRQNGVTTVVIETVLGNTLLLMNAAEAQGWQPEWVQFSANGIDFNNNPRLMPPNQAAHLFGLSAWEVPRPPAQQECYAAYRSIDPTTEPDASVCKLYFHPMVMLMNGIQEAGPKLNQATFDQALIRMGRRFPAEPWAIGGGFGPGDYTYMDNLSEIWWDRTAFDSAGAGAYRWTRNARRYQRGQFDTDDSRLFVDGVVEYGGSEQVR